MTVDSKSCLSIVDVGPESLGTIAEINRIVFKEERIINTFDRDEVIMLLSWVGGVPVGFKIGYRENRRTFYSAKGGVLPGFRRRGIARAMMSALNTRARSSGYRTMAFDTFPNRHPGMTILALNEGYRITQADFNPTYRDYRLRFEIAL